MQKTIFLILTLLATLRASAIPINVPLNDGHYIFDFKITVGPGSDLPAGTAINGQFGGVVMGDWIDVNYDIEFDFYDPNRDLHKQHQVARDGYTDWAPFSRNGGGYFELIGNHPRHPNFYHELEFGFDGSGNAEGFIRGGPCYDCNEPDIDVDFYYYDFTGDITIAPQQAVTNVPETNSTLALMTGAFVLMMLARKKLATA